MTQEEKQLLLKDLCARLPYGVRVRMEAQTKPYFRVEFTLLPKHDGGIGRLQIWLETGDRYLVQPYLRPMSSMTEEEIDEFKSLFPFPNGDMFVDNSGITVYEINGETYLSYLMLENVIDWLNVHHFDYNGLIEKGLALEAPEGMYK